MASRNALTILAIVVLVAALAAGNASAVELRDAELIAGGSPVLQNGLGTEPLEDARLGRLGRPVFVPERGALWQLGSGVGLLVLLEERRRRSTASDLRRGRPRTHGSIPRPPPERAG